LIKSDEKTPLSNVYLTVLNQLDIQAGSFADSTATMNELTA